MHRDVHLAIVFNTLWALLTQKDQVRCLRSIAGHPTEDSAFLTGCTSPTQPDSIAVSGSAQAISARSDRRLQSPSFHAAANPKRVHASLRIVS